MLVGCLFFYGGRLVFNTRAKGLCKCPPNRFDHFRPCRKQQPIWMLRARYVCVCVPLSKICVLQQLPADVRN